MCRAVQENPDPSGDIALGMPDGSLIPLRIKEVIIDTAVGRTVHPNPFYRYGWDAFYLFPKSGMSFVRWKLRSKRVSNRLRKICREVNAVMNEMQP